MVIQGNTKWMVFGQWNNWDYPKAEIGSGRFKNKPCKGRTETKHSYKVAVGERSGKRLLSYRGSDR